MKDPVYKHTLTYHLAEYMLEYYPEGTDLYTEFGAVARSARVCLDEESPIRVSLVLVRITLKPLDALGGLQGAVRQLKAT